VQFTRESIHATEVDNRSLRDRFLQSEFLRDFRTLAQSSTRGCIVLERPDLLKQLVEKHGARDSTARGTALAELEGMQVRTSQYNPITKSPKRTGSIASPSGTGSTTSASIADMITARRPRRGCWVESPPGQHHEERS